MSLLPDFFRGTSAGNPFREFSRLQREMDRLLDPLDRPGRADYGLAIHTWAPACEITETEQAYELKAELPGVKKDDVKIDLEENRVSLTAEKREEKKDDKKHFSEVTYGTYSRTFSLPQAIDTERSVASFEHGVLKISMSKAKPTAAKSRSISIK